MREYSSHTLADTPERDPAEAADLLYYRNAPPDAIRMELAEYEIDAAPTILAVSELIHEYYTVETATLPVPVKRSVTKDDHGRQDLQKLRRYSDLLVSYLPTIERIAAFVCRRNRLEPADAADFVADVRLKFIESDYELLRKIIRRPSSFATYVAVVVQRLFFSFRAAAWGRWRPSAEAKRLGPLAISLERLLTRDGYSFEEAVQTLTTGETELSRSELEALYVRLPPRPPRRQVLSVSSMPDVAAPTVDSETVCLWSERQHIATKTAQIVNAQIESLSSDDRAIIALRFWNEESIPSIAKQIGADPKHVYKRIELILRVLRNALIANGINSESVAEIVERRDCDVSFNAFPRRPFVPAVSRRLRTNTSACETIH